jgi:hypothetical protein
MSANDITGTVHIDFRIGRFHVASAKATFTIHVNPAAAPPITFSPAGGPLPDETVGQPATGAVSVSGGTPPLSVALTNGALPDGVSLDGAGNLTGSPTAAGDFSFELTATDSLG